MRKSTKRRAKSAPSRQRRSPRSPRSTKRRAKSAPSRRQKIAVSAARGGGISRNQRMLENRWKGGPGSGFLSLGTSPVPAGRRRVSAVRQHALIEINLSFALIYFLKIV